MAFRRMPRRPRGRKRTKVLWDRAFTIVPLLAFGTPTSQSIGDPTILPGSALGFDMNRTVRRIRLNVSIAFLNDIPATPVTGDWICGVYVANSDSTVRNPAFSATDDLEADWLDLWMMPFRSSLDLQTSNTVVYTYDAAHNHRDIRVNRKLENDEIIVFTCIPNATTGAISLDSGEINLQQSLLWTASPT